MPFQNRLQYDKQWDITVPIIICTFLGLVAQIDLLIHVTIFWNLPNRNFNTFIAQFTFTSHDESWENLFIDIHIDRERSNRVNPTPGRSPMSDTLQYIRNQRSHPLAPPEPHEESSDEESNDAEETDLHFHETKQRLGYRSQDLQIIEFRKPSIMNGICEYPQCLTHSLHYSTIHQEGKW